MMDHRNLYGYGEHPPHADWPGGARVAVSLVLNIEEGSERAISRGDDRNEPIYDMIQEPGSEPDLAMESHFDYGARAGYWRIARVLRKYDATCTLNICAEALERTPWIAEDGLAHGYEFGCHGDRWMSPIGLSEREEAAMIARAVARIRKVAGVRPVGWHSRSPCTPNTRRLLVEEGGFIYDSEAYDDDLPYIVEVAGRKHVVVPYSLDTNDMRFQRPDSSFARARGLLRLRHRRVRLAMGGGRDDAQDDDDRAPHPHHRPAGPHRRTGPRPRSHQGQGRGLDRAARRDRPPLAGHPRRRGSDRGRCRRFWRRIRRFPIPAMRLDVADSVSRSVRRTSSGFDPSGLPSTRLSASCSVFATNRPERTIAPNR